MTDKRLEKFIQDRMILVQTQFDTAKSTLLTAGLVVALSVGVPGFDKVLVWGHSGTKTILMFAILSAIFLLISFVFAEHQVKRHDKLMGGIVVTKLEAFMVGSDKDRQAKIIPWFYGALHSKLITYCNNLSTISLLIAMFMFLYCLMAS